MILYLQECLLREPSHSPGTKQADQSQEPLDILVPVDAEISTQTPSGTMERLSVLYFIELYMGLLLAAFRPRLR